MLSLRSVGGWRKFSVGNVLYKWDAIQHYRGLSLSQGWNAQLAVSKSSEYQGGASLSSLLSNLYRRMHLDQLGHHSLGCIKNSRSRI